MYVSKVLNFSRETCQMTDDKFCGWYSLKVRIPAFVCNKLKCKQSGTVFCTHATILCSQMKWSARSPFCCFSLQYVWKALWSETEIIRNQEEKIYTQPFYTSLANSILIRSSSKIVFSYLICSSWEIQNFANTQKVFILVIRTKCWVNILSTKPG